MLSGHQAKDSPIQHLDIAAGLGRLVTALGVDNGVKIDQPTAPIERMGLIDGDLSAQDVAFEHRRRVIAAAPGHQRNEIRQCVGDLGLSLIHI